MPTHDEFARFIREFSGLTEAEQEQFLDAMMQMVQDLRVRRPYRAGLRVKIVQGYTGIFEMTWAGDGRATFEYGDEQRPGEVHIIWRRIGGHDVLKNP